MDANELRRLAGKIVNDKRKTSQRFKAAYGWEVLEALARFYLEHDGDVPVDMNPHHGEFAPIVERTAGGMTGLGGFVVGGPTVAAMYTKPGEDPAPPSGSGAPSLDGGNSSAPAPDRPATISRAEGWTAELQALAERAKFIVERLSEAQFLALDAVMHNHEMTGHKKTVIDALIRKDLFIEGAGLTALGRIVHGLAAESYRP